MTIQIQSPKKILRLPWQKQITILAFLGFIVFVVRRFIYQIFVSPDYQGYQVTEMLINYRAGFVRRGLTGEITWWLQHSLGWSPYQVSNIFCLICFLCVTTYFIWKSAKEKISFAYLPLIYICAINILWRDWYRKDCLMIIAFIGCMYILRSFLSNRSSTIKSMILINIITSLIFLIHESFCFFSLPLFALIIYSKYKEKNSNIKSLLESCLFLAPSVIVLLIVLSHKGNTQTAMDIWQSWGGKSYFGAAKPTSAIGAIGWTMNDAITKHLESNFVGDYDLHIMINKDLLWIICLVIIYFATFRWNKIHIGFCSTYKEMNHSLSIGCLIMFQALFLLPLFTILSCDYGRICYYLFASSYAAYLILGEKTILSIYPKLYKNIIISFVGKNKILPNIKDDAK